MNELHINEEQGSLTPNTMPKKDHLGGTKDPSLTGLMPKKDHLGETKEPSLTGLLPKKDGGTV